MRISKVMEDVASVARGFGVRTMPSGMLHKLHSNTWRIPPHATDGRRPRSLQFQFTKSGTLSRGNV